MTRAERIASKILAADQPLVHATDDWVLANGGRVPWSKRRGVLVGICNGKLRVIVDGTKNAKTFHESFWRLP